MEPPPGDDYDLDQLDWSSGTADTGHGTARDSLPKALPFDHGVASPATPKIVAVGSLTAGSPVATVQTSAMGNAIEFSNIGCGVGMSQELLPFANNGSIMMTPGETTPPPASTTAATPADSGDCTHSSKSESPSLDRAVVTAEHVASSAVASNGQPRPTCRYGRGCSHTSTLHRARYSHPCDVTWGGSSSAIAGRPSQSTGSGHIAHNRTSVIMGGGGAGGRGMGAGEGGGGTSKRFMCNECGLDFASVSELQLHMIRKTAWSNQGLIGCRVSCLVDNREWHEGLVTQVCILDLYCSGRVS